MIKVRKGLTCGVLHLGGISNDSFGQDRLLSFPFTKRFSNIHNPSLDRDDMPTAELVIKNDGMFQDVQGW